MNIQQQNGIVSTINFTPFSETEECMSLRKLIFDQAIVASNCSPTNQIDIFDESILVFDSYYQALNFLVNLFRSLNDLEKYSSVKTILRSSLCQGNYFVHQDQIYGDAVNLATRLCCSSRENELLVCGIESQIVEDFIKKQGDVACFIRNQDENCVSIGLLDKDLTDGHFEHKLFQLVNNNQSLVFETSRNRKINIGRAEDSDIFIDSDHISRNHATITLNYDNVFIEDHSSNGTYLYFDDREIFLTNDRLKLGCDDGFISLGRDRQANIESSGIVSFLMLDQTRSAA